MTAAKTFVMRNPVATYFVLTVLISWMRALTYDLVLAAALWLLIAALAMANGWQLSRQLLRPRVA